ncbi:MAG TPA: hypothetical protein VFW38_10045 [Solirubrobacteraceae bacterium]|nr:hypothetical protein [Solirubrobacteraceae bacterium]
MHTLIAQVAVPVLAAAKSKTPFYIAGGVLVGWALLLFAMGTRKPEIPGNRTSQRAIMAVSVVLVLFTLTMAVATSGGG